MCERLDLSEKMTEQSGLKSFGRPTKNDAPRSARIEIRVTPEEKEALQKAAAGYGLSVADYIILKAIPSGPETAYPPLAELRSLGHELVRQGTNLNQISSALNRLVRAGWVDGTTRDDLNKMAWTLDALVGELRPGIVSASDSVMALLDGARPKRGRR